MTGPIALIALAGAAGAAAGASFAGATPPHVSITAGSTETPAATSSIEWCAPASRVSVGCEPTRPR
jgi:hypothetical protein